MTFHHLALSDREAMQAVTLPSGRRNCNYTFANLVGWKFLFGTEVCVLENAVVLRYTFDGRRAYMVCTSEALSLELIEGLFDDSIGDLTLIGLEDSQVPQCSMFNGQWSLQVQFHTHMIAAALRQQSGIDALTNHGRSIAKLGIGSQIMGHGKDVLHGGPHLHALNDSRTYGQVVGKADLS